MRIRHISIIIFVEALFSDGFMPPDIGSTLFLHAVGRLLSATTHLPAGVVRVLSVGAVAASPLGRLGPVSVSLGLLTLARPVHILPRAVSTILVRRIRSSIGFIN